MKVKMIRSKDDSFLNYKTLSRIEYAEALSFYHANFDRDDARTFLKSYISKKDPQFNIALIDKIPDCWIPISAAWVSRMLMLECTLPSIDNGTFIMTHVEKALEKIPNIESLEKNIKIEEEKENGDKPLTPKKVELLTEVDEIIDTINFNEGLNPNFSFYEWLKEHDAKSCHIPVLIQKLERLLEEYTLVLEGKDEELCEGYSHLTKTVIKSRINIYQKVIEDAIKYRNNAKQGRKPRKKKTITSDMKLKFFKCKKEDIGLKIVSIDPSKILGAMELFVFDTTYRKVTHFVAKDGNGLDVYRTAITSFDEKETHTYLVGLKKTEWLLNEFSNGGKVHKRKTLQQLKIAPKLSERINEDIILLAVY